MNCFLLNDRSFTDYRPRCMSQEQIKWANNYEYRQFMMKNGNTKIFEGMVNSQVVKAETIVGLKKDNEQKAIQNEITRQEELLLNNEIFNELKVNEKTIGILDSGITGIEKENNYLLNNLNEEKMEVNELEKYIQQLNEKKI